MWRRPSSGEISRLIDGLCGEGLPAIDLAHVDLSGSKQRPEQHGRGVGGRQHGLGFDPPLELFVEPFDPVGGACPAPLARRQTRESEEPVAGFLQAVGDGFVLKPPLADEGFAARFDLFWRFRVDHFVVVVGDLLIHALRGVREEIAVLMPRASLYQHAIPNGGDRALKPRAAIDDEKLGPPQAALDEIVEHGAPSLGALATHLLDRQEHFLAVLAHPDDDEQRDGSGFAVEPHTNHGAVENQAHNRLIRQRAGIPRVPVALHLAPYPAHRVLAYLSAKYAAKCAAHAAPIGAGQIRARDQRVGSQRAALIFPQRLALPLRRLAVGSVQPGAWHRDLGLPERAGQRAYPAPMPMAGNSRGHAAILRRPRSPAIAWARQNGVKLTANHLLDQFANAVTYPGLDGIKPIVEKMRITLGRRMRKLRRRGNGFHGVVSCLAL